MIQPSGQRTGHTAYNRAVGASKPAIDHFGEDIMGAKKGWIKG